MIRRILNGSERAVYGLTASIRERTTGEQRLIVVTGLAPVAALRDIASQIDELEGEWYVAALSTPETIHTDLLGREERKSTAPENTMLARIGRMDLLRDRPAWARSDGRRQTAAGGT